MQTIDLEGGPVRIAGALDLDRSPSGISPRRLPAWTRPQITDPLTKAVVAMPSGVRLEFSTDATALELDVLTTTLQTGDRIPADPAFDLVVDGEFFERQTTVRGNRLLFNAVTQEVRLERGEVDTMHFDGLAPTMKRIELWLPQNASMRLQTLRISDGARAVAPTLGGRRRWIHYGSSISHCMEAAGPTGVWPVVTARLADLDLQSLGLGGSCHLDQFAARTIRDLPADLISLKVGINVVNGETLKERTFGPALHGFLDTVRDGHPRTPLLLVSPIICPCAEDHPGPTVPDAGGVFRVIDRPAALMNGCLTLRRIREIVSDIVAMRRDAGDTNIHYLDGLALFGEADLGDLPDGLHPNGPGYQRMGERFHAAAFAKGASFAAR